MFSSHSIGENSPPPLLTVFLSHHSLFLSLLPAVHLPGSEKQDLHPSTAWSPMIEAAVWKLQSMPGGNSLLPRPPSQLKHRCLWVSSAFSSGDYWCWCLRGSTTL